MPKSQVIYRKPYRIKKKKSILKNQFFWLIILVSIIFGSIFYFLFFSEVFQVEKIIVTGEKKVSNEALKLLIEEKLENKILFFKTKSIFLVNLNETRKDILNQFPQIAEVEIHRGFPDALNIVVVERLGIATWCVVDKCFLTDENGIVFEEGEGENLSRINDSRKTTLPTLGEKIIEKENLSKILEINSKLSDFKIPIKEFMIVSDEKLTGLTTEDWEVYFNLQKDIEWQLTKLRAVLEEKIPPEKRKDLEYIELRFGNFAPFKYKQ